MVSKACKASSRGLDKSLLAYSNDWRYQPPSFGQTYGTEGVPSLTPQQQHQHAYMAQAQQSSMFILADLLLGQILLNS